MSGDDDGRCRASDDPCRSPCANPRLGGRAAGYRGREQPHRVRDCNTDGDNADLAPVMRRPTRGSLKRAPRPRKEFGAHLEQVEIVIEPEIPPGYEGLEKVLIGEDVSKRLDVTPGKFRLIVTRRPKYAYRNRDGVVQPAALPSPDRERPSNRGTSRPDCDGQIRRRLAAVPAEAIYARDSVDLDRSLMAQWMGKVGFELQPLRAERRSCCDCAGRRPGQGRCHI